MEEKRKAEHPKKEGHIEKEVKKVGEHMKKAS